ncbi:MAG: DUF4268 domain-containing protein [bacterium]|nr:DUF4268 domain-containing protein [bacterium]
MNNETHIGKLEKVPLRKIWEHEALDFTTGLQGNLDVLNAQLNINLCDAERESAAGSFNVDIVAKDEDGNTVIIENQLEKSDHKHLGQILTYLTAMDAKTAIWIASDARPEHINAINWLNESSAADFYFFKLEGIKIDDSKPAPLLTLITGPSDEAKEIGAKKKELAQRERLRYQFWQGLLEKAKTKTRLHNSVSPGIGNWLHTRAGKSGIGYNYGITRTLGKIELYISRGKDSDDECKKIFDQLYAHKDEIEKTFGEQLIWERMDDKRASRVTFEIHIGGYKDEGRIDKTQDAMIDAMIRMEKAFKSYISKLKI